MNNGDTRRQHSSRDRVRHFGFIVRVCCLLVFAHVAQGLSTGPTGPRGLIGPHGVTGATGPTGDRGLRGFNGVGFGATGPRGATGADGATGVTGPAGVAGPTGAQGNVGAQGATGPTGAASTVVGPTGAQGVTGAQGPIGVTGATGATGAVSAVAGPTGAQGVIGPTGAQGPTGALGEGFQEDSAGTIDEATLLSYAAAADAAGEFAWYHLTTVDNRADHTSYCLATDTSRHWVVWVKPAAHNCWMDYGLFTAMDGVTGPRGATGAQGSVGATGATGAVGAQGNVGAQGVIGPTGVTGAVGAQGVIGPTGVTGAVGAQGNAGTNGAVGATGATGGVGAQGVVGPTGAIGATGAVGAQGVIGPTGATGPGLVYDKLLYVAPVVGNDGTADGSIGKPFKTVQAAMTAAPTVTATMALTIMLAPGAYGATFVPRVGLGYRCMGVARTCNFTTMNFTVPQPPIANTITTFEGLHIGDLSYDARLPTITSTVRFKDCDIALTFMNGANEAHVTTYVESSTVMPHSGASDHIIGVLRFKNTDLGAVTQGDPNEVYGNAADVSTLHLNGGSLSGIISVWGASHLYLTGVDVSGVTTLTGGSVWLMSSLSGGTAETPTVHSDRSNAAALFGGDAGNAVSYGFNWVQTDNTQALGTGSAPTFNGMIMNGGITMPFQPATSLLFINSLHTVRGTLGLVSSGGVTIALDSGSSTLTVGSQLQVYDKLLYVDPVVGNDGSFDGSIGRPFKTVQHAMAVAPVVTATSELTIMLAPGSYGTTLVPRVGLGYKCMGVARSCNFTAVNFVMTQPTVANTVTSFEGLKINNLAYNASVPTLTATVNFRDCYIAASILDGWTEAHVTTYIIGSTLVEVDPTSYTTGSMRLRSSILGSLHQGHAYAVVNGAISTIHMDGGSLVGTITLVGYSVLYLVYVDVSSVGAIVGIIIFEDVSWSSTPQQDGIPTIYTTHEIATELFGSRLDYLPGAHGFQWVNTDGLQDLSTMGTPTFNDLHITNELHISYSGIIGTNIDGNLRGIGLIGSNGITVVYTIPSSLVTAPFLTVGLNASATINITGVVFNGLSSTAGLLGKTTGKAAEDVLLAGGNGVTLNFTSNPATVTAALNASATITVFGVIFATPGVVNPPVLNYYEVVTGGTFTLSSSISCVFPGQTVAYDLVRIGKMVTLTLDEIPNEVPVHSGSLIFDAGAILAKWRPTRSITLTSISVVEPVGCSTFVSGLIRINTDGSMSIYASPSQAGWTTGAGCAGTNGAFVVSWQVA